VTRRTPSALTGRLPLALFALGVADGARVAGLFADAGLLDGFVLARLGLGGTVGVVDDVLFGHHTLVSLANLAMNFFEPPRSK
jgi:hypothetical protein